MRTVCNFYHPAVRNTNLGFHWDQYRKPPLEEIQETGKIPSMPVRIPVIVRNNLLSRKEFPNLSQKLKGMSLDYAIRVKEKEIEERNEKGREYRVRN